MRPTSLRRQLLRWLLGPLVAVLVAGAIGSYFTALRIATEAYDKSLLDPALAIAQQLKTVNDRVALELPSAVLDALSVDSTDRLFFAVSAQGTHIAGVRELTAPPVAPIANTPLYYDGFVHGERVRIAVLAVPYAGGTVLIQVAETRVKRNRVVRQLLLSSTVPEVLFLAAALAVVWFGVARGLAPLAALRAEIASRSHLDLRPVREGQAPVELRPIVQELNDLLARLAASIEAQQRFIADAAHQLRTPLAAMQAQVEAAAREELPERLRVTVDNLRSATQRTTHLARQLLLLARVDPSGERTTALQSVDLAEIGKARLDAWLAQADRAGIDLGFELNPAPVQGDAILLQELATNIVDNALRYTGHGGVVTLRTLVRDGVPCLEVEDNGPGIPREKRQTVFERFHRLQGAPGEGSGLGLAIVREIARRHGGEVEIVEPATGRGAVVRVRFSARPPA